MKTWMLLVSFIISVLFLSPSSLAITKNGFDLSNSLIPVQEILAGGPPKDGIPSIDHPRFIRARQVDFLSKQSRILGVVRNSIVKAYPVAILNWHEIVNDFFGKEALVISYCPLCGTGMVFSARRGTKEVTFGVSGLLYNSDVLLYDRETESLWSQIESKAIAGPLRGEKLDLIASENTTWADWLRRYPNTLVLSTKTGFRRDYTRNPYAGYENSKKVWFPISNVDRRYHPKERILGIEVNGKFKAFPFVELHQGPGSFQETFNGKRIKVIFNKTEESGQIYDSQGRLYPLVQAYWFAWSAFHPATEVYQAR